MEPMSHGLGVFIMMNNYFHDVATAMLAASAIAMRLLIMRYPESPRPALQDYFRRVSRAIAIFARVCLGWVLVGGIPRTVYFSGFEWATAVEHGQTAALTVKHVLIICFVLIGTELWRRNNVALRLLLPRSEDK